MKVLFLHGDGGGGNGAGLKSTLKGEKTLLLFHGQCRELEMSHSKCDSWSYKGSALIQRSSH
jgi:hypothetical protein